jgi:hypothetical protein
VTMRHVVTSTLWQYNSAEGATCAQAGNVLSCAVADIPVGGARVVTLTVSPRQAGTLGFSSSVSGTLTDPELADNVAGHMVLVTETPPWFTGAVAAPTGAASGGALLMARARRSDITLDITLNPPPCSGTGLKVTAYLNGLPYIAVPVPGQVSIAGAGQASSWRARIPAGFVESGVIEVFVEDSTGCRKFVRMGTVVLYDPSGIVSDKATGQPIVGATVTLYKVPGALPDEGGVTKQCRTVDTRPGGAGGNWDSLPPANLASGVLPSLLFDPGEIKPVVNPQKTNSIGYYGWDVAKGCWFVKVEAQGYQTVISPLVGVPPAVLDLNIKMERGGKLVLPFIRR